MIHSILIDVTRCVACEKCIAACVECHDLDPKMAELDRAVTRDGLSASRLVSIQKVDNGRFARKSCMHCIEPSCVSACLVGGISKKPEGPVVYDRDKCIGCRYCMLACPFHIPRYEWNRKAPFMVKCDMCSDRLSAGEQPACVEACQEGALKYGDRETLIQEAHALIGQNPERYIYHIWGEKEFGGTSVLYISDVDLETIGWPTTDAAAIPSLTEPLIHKTPLIGFTVAFSLIGLNWIVNRRNQVAALDGHDPEYRKSNDGTFHA
jgi:formate dehydrogenase iron-sulfur subunit